MTHLFLSLSLHSISTYHYCFFKSAVIVILLSPAFIFSSNKHRCSHTLILTFKNLSFYKSGEIYPLLSLSLPSAAPTQPLAHYFIVFSLFLLPSLTHPPTLLSTSVPSPASVLQPPPCPPLCFQTSIPGPPKRYVGSCSCILLLIP